MTSATSVRITRSDFASSPREDENIAIMLCKHGRYNLGDENAHKSFAELLELSHHDYSIPQLIDIAEKRNLLIARKPLYLYDHSGITISTTPFACQWDSGQVGEIIVLKAAMKEAFGIKRFGARILEKMIIKADEIIEEEVKVYDDFLTGEVYSLEILDENGDVIDNCNSFIGSDIHTNGILDYIPENLKEEAIQQFENC